MECSCRSIVGYSFGTIRKMKPEIIKPVVDEMFELLKNIEFKLPIYKIFNLSEVAAAHKLMENRQHYGKILLKP